VRVRVESIASFFINADSLPTSIQFEMNNPLERIIRSNLT